MDNNDILIRLRYALDIKDTDMVKIFNLEGITLTKEEVRKMLIKPKDDIGLEAEAIDEADESRKCTNDELAAFLNGFITFKRGKQEQSEQPEKIVLSLKNQQSINNVMLKKLKIALSLTSEDMLDVFKEAGVIVTKGELGALFRKEGHKNYKECGDKYARNFLKGLALKNRK